MDAYDVLNSNASASASAPASRVAGIACKNQQDFYVKHNGGYMIPTHSKTVQEMRIHFEKLLDEHGNNEFIPACLENDTPTFYLNREVKSEETYNVRATDQHVRPTTTLSRGAVPIGDDIEPVGESRAVFEQGNEEEESLESEIPTVETNPKNLM